MENPSGNYAAEAKRITIKANNFATTLTSAALTPSEAYTMYNTICIRSVGYGMSSSCLSIALAEKAQSKLVSRVLQFLGYNQNTPREVVFAKPALRGIGIQHLFSIQGTQQVRSLLYHGRKCSTVGRMLTIQLKWAQKVSEISSPLTQNTAQPLPHLDSEQWIQTLRTFLKLSNLSVRSTTVPGIKMKRVNDKAIMDIVTTNPTFKRRRYRRHC